MDYSDFAIPKDYSDKHGLKYTLIDGVRHYPDGREVCDKRHKSGREIYKGRRDHMWQRDGGLCCICREPVAKAEATFEHVNGRGMGGSTRDDRTEWVDKDGVQHRNGVAHLWCNTQKGSKRGLKL